MNPPGEEQPFRALLRHSNKCSLHCGQLLGLPSAVFPTGRRPSRSALPSSAPRSGSGRSYSFSRLIGQMLDASYWRALIPVLDVRVSGTSPNAVSTERPPKLNPENLPNSAA